MITAIIYNIYTTFVTYHYIFNLISMGREQRKIILFAHSFIDEVYIFVNILYYFSHYLIFIIIHFYYIDDTAMDK